MYIKLLVNLYTNYKTTIIIDTNNYFITLKKLLKKQKCLNFLKKILKY